MLLAASETQDLKLAKQAAGYAENIAPKDVKVIAQAGEIMLWLNSPKDGYPYYKKAAIMTGGNREYVMNLIQIASYTGDKSIFRDAADTAIRLRPDVSRLHCWLLLYGPLPVTVKSEIAHFAICRAEL